MSTPGDTIIPSSFLCVASFLHTPTALRPWLLGWHARPFSYPDLPSGSMATGTGKRFTRKFMTEPVSMSPPRYQSGVWGLARARTSKRGPPPRRPRLDLLQTAETTFSAHTNYTGDQDCASVLGAPGHDRISSGAIWSASILATRTTQGFVRRTENCIERGRNATGSDVFRASWGKQRDVRKGFSAGRTRGHGCTAPAAGAGWDISKTNRRAVPLGAHTRQR